MNLAIEYRNRRERTGEIVKEGKVTARNVFQFNVIKQALMREGFSEPIEVRYNQDERGNYTTPWLWRTHRGNTEVNIYTLY